MAPDGHGAGRVLEKLVASACFALAIVGFVTFWPPRSASTLAWVVSWSVICLVTGLAILRRHRAAPFSLWVLVALSGLSALSLLVRGGLQGVGMVVDVVLIGLLVWLAVWYHRKRRKETTTQGR